MTQYERIAQLEVSLTLRDHRYRRNRIVASIVALTVIAAAITIPVLA